MAPGNVKTVNVACASAALQICSTAAEAPIANALRMTFSLQRGIARKRGTPTNAAMPQTRISGRMAPTRATIETALGRMPFR
jgi:hypothetical protein